MKLAAGQPIVVKPYLDTCLDNPFVFDVVCLSPRSENCLIRDNSFQTRPGIVSLGGAFGEVVLGSIGLRSLDDVSQVIIGTSSKWRKFNSAGLTWDDISGGLALTQSAFPVTFAYFFQGGIQYVIGVNGADATKEFDLAGTAYADLENAPIARTVTTVVNRLMFGAIGAGNSYLPQTVKWSATGQRTVYPALAFNDLTDTPDHIVQIGNLGRRAVAIMKEESQWLALSQPGSDANAFEFQLLDYQPGPIGPAAGDRGPRGLQWIYLGTDGNLRAFDGVTGTIIKNTQKYIGTRLNFNRRHLTTVRYIPNRQEIWSILALDMDDYPTHLMVYSYLTNGLYLERLQTDIPVTHLGRINAEYDTVTDDLPDLPTDQQLNVPTDQLGVTAPGSTILVGGTTGAFTADGLSDSGGKISNDWRFVLPIIPRMEYEFDGVELQMQQSASDPLQISVLAGQNFDSLTETILGTIVPTASPTFGETHALHLQDALRARIVVVRFSGYGFFTMRRFEVYAWPRSVMA